MEIIEKKGRLKLSKWADYWCTNVDDEFVILCYRHQQGEILKGWSECIKTTNGIHFDNQNPIRLNKDYNEYAKMVTFQGQAVIVGIVNTKINLPDGSDAQSVFKHVEIFDKERREWSLKTPEDKYGVRWTSNFALIPFKNKLLQLGGRDIGEGQLSYHGRLAFFLNSTFTAWTPVGKQVQFAGHDPMLGTD